MAANSAIGMIVPTSLLAHMTETSATSSWSPSASRSAAGATEPSRVDRQPGHLGAFVFDEPLHRVEHRVVLDRAW